MAKTYTVELTEKEMVVLWRLLTWFRYPVTGVLRSKFQGVPHRRRFELCNQFGDAIDTQLANQGLWLTEYRRKAHSTPDARKATIDAFLKRVDEIEGDFGHGAESVYDRIDAVKREMFNG
jgi:hypothetical protein